MFARRLHIVITAVILLGLLASCTPSAAPTAAPTAVVPANTSAPPAVAAPTTTSGGEQNPKVLQAWVNLGDDPAQVQALFNKYTDLTGIKVEVTMPVAYDKIFAGLAGDNPPDLLIVPEVFALRSMREEGLIIPLKDYITSTGIDLKDLVPSTLNQCAYKDNYWCIPWGMDTHILFWNKDMFEEAGLDPEKPPETLEQLVEYSDKLTKFDADKNPTQIGFLPDFPTTHLWNWLIAFGINTVSADGTKVTIDTPEMKALFAWERSFYTKYGTDQTLKFTSGMNAFNSPDMGFYTGKVAMMIEGEYQVGPNYIQKFKPELNYGVTAIPYLASNPERKNLAAVFGTVIEIPSGAKYKDASAKLMAWLETPEIQTAQFTQNFNLPNSIKAALDPKFHENKKFETFINLGTGPTATTFFTSPVTPDILIELFTIEEQVVHGGADPEPLLKAAQEKLQPILDAALTK